MVFTFDKKGDAKKLAEMEDRLKRVAADFENFKKRNDKERAALKDGVSAELILKLLPTLDEFEIALKHEGDEEFKHGMEMVYEKMRKTLEAEGLQQMETDGKPFNPELHDAIRHEKGEDGIILETIVKGYMFKGNVLRHAKVVVGKK